MKSLLPLIMLALLAGCTTPPKGIEAVKGFELERYLGKWYEIARLDHGFERGLTRVTAEYTPRDDGGINVINRGYDAESGEWKEADGKAYFVEGPDTGQLKVSFFGPFYGGYTIVDLDQENYQYALVSGPTRDYLWILARNPDISAMIIDKLVARADELGFATEDLIYLYKN
ncbi:MAG: lipocalin family protein [Gammaproteobacteria bacterium]